MIFGLALVSHRIGSMAPLASKRRGYSMPKHGQCLDGNTGAVLLSHANLGSFYAALDLYLKKYP